MFQSFVIKWILTVVIGECIQELYQSLPGYKVTKTALQLMSAHLKTHSK